LSETGAFYRSLIRILAIRLRVKFDSKASERVKDSITIQTIELSGKTRKMHAKVNENVLKTRRAATLRSVYHPAKSIGI
jgi:hypothetical protein